MPPPLPNTTYQSPPRSGGNDGAVPTVYDPSWQFYNNLNSAQKLAFASFPQDLIYYTGVQRWLAEISGITVAGIPLATGLMDQQKIAGLMQAFDRGVLASTPFFDNAGNVQNVTAVQFAPLYAAVVQFVDSTYTTAATLVAGITATPQTVTTRKQIDAAFAAIAPNSPSAKTPSLT